MGITSWESRNKQVVGSWARSWMKLSNLGNAVQLGNHGCHWHVLWRCQLCVLHFIKEWSAERRNLSDHSFPPPSQGSCCCHLSVPQADDFHFSLLNLLLSGCHPNHSNESALDLGTPRCQIQWWIFCPVMTYHSGLPHPPWNPFSWFPSCSTCYSFLVSFTVSQPLDSCPLVISSCVIALKSYMLNFISNLDIFLNSYIQLPTGLFSWASKRHLLLNMSKTKFLVFPPNMLYQRGDSASQIMAI